MKYRSKQDPTRVVDAVQWTGDNAAEVVAWCKANQVVLLFHPDGSVKIDGTTLLVGSWVYADAGYRSYATASAFAHDHEPYTPSATELATPGEWRFVHNGTPDRGGRYIALPEPSGGLAVVYWRESDAERDANGRLTAASKDLYDAAVAARKALQGLPGHYSYCRMCPRPGPYTELIADLTKAIAKADQS